MRSRLVCASMLIGGVVLGPGAACAQNAAQAQTLRLEIDQLRQDFNALKQQYGDRLATLEAKLAAIQGGPQAASPPTTVQVPPGAEGAGGPSGALPVYGAAVASSKVFNPDIAVIGDFLGAVGRNPNQPDPFNPGSSHASPLQMHESEAAFQAVVDPY